MMQDVLICKMHNEECGMGRRTVLYSAFFIVHSVFALPLLAASRYDPTTWWKSAKWEFDGVFVVLAAALLAGVTVQALVSLRRRWLEASHPHRLFRRIAGQIGLDARQCRKLEQVARARSLESPLTLLLSAGTMNHYFTGYLGGLPQDQAAEEGRQLEAIRKRMFEE